MLIRWTDSGTQTTLRCPRCGFQETRSDAEGDPEATTEPECVQPELQREAS
jgi:hypothetical protein